MPDNNNNDNNHPPIIANKRPIPRKLNDGMIKALYEAISRGNYAVVACQLAGIEEKTYYEWLRQADIDIENGLTAEESYYVRLKQSVKEAESKAEDEMVQVVREAATKKREWLPATVFLERRHPDRWGRRERKQVDINETRQIRITHVEIGIVAQPGEVERAVTPEIPEAEQARIEARDD